MSTSHGQQLMLLSLQDSFRGYVGQILPLSPLSPGQPGERMQRLTWHLELSMDFTPIISGSRPFLSFLCISFLSRTEETTNHSCMASPKQNRKPRAWLPLPRSNGNRRFSPMSRSSNCLTPVHISETVFCLHYCMRLE